MKKKIIISLLALIAMISVGNAQSVEDVINLIKAKKWQVKKLEDKTFVLHTFVKSTRGRIKSKDTLRITIPQGTKSLAFRVTVLDVKSKYQFEPEEKFDSLVKKYRPTRPYSPSKYSVNFFFFDHSGQVQSFLVDGNYIPVYSKMHMNSFVDTFDVNGDTYWLALDNHSSYEGIKVVVEMLALGNY